jgi:DNA-binding NarL/FixJ family response regulator
MTESLLQLGTRDRRIVELLLQGRTNIDIAGHLHISARSVRSDLNRLFVRFGIRNGIKRVKLATLFRQRHANRRSDLRTPYLLNKREQEIVALVAEGLKNHEIAERMGTTEGVIKNYLGVIYDKLGLWNRVELALWHLTRSSKRLMSADRKPGVARLRFPSSSQLICLDVAEKTAG